jgi:hypothetical protein
MMFRGPHRALLPLLVLSLATVAQCHTTAGPVIAPHDGDSDVAEPNADADESPDAHDDTDADESADADEGCPLGLCLVDGQEVCRCALVDQQRCSPARDSIERCTLGDAGCAGWIIETMCEDDEHCVLDDAGAIRFRCIQ